MTEAYYTLLKNSSSGKSGSLINFGQKAVLAQSQGYDYREVVWTATFKKKSATIDGEAVSYYVLDFGYSEPDEAALKRVDQAVAVLESQEDMQKLFDPALEAATQCVDGLNGNAPRAAGRKSSRSPRSNTREYQQRVAA